ncbi:MAG TPA: YhjD/YihY/BrkB family envelope integrity protein [Streptosporangiaceae bacterium]|jgi:uncharacterized BrkB/YihY/UPF0761 family membrane protein
MNPIEKVIRRVDAVQQRHKATAFVFGLIKKYGDDNGGVLAANLAHSGFVSVFPLLLVLVTLLGLVASNDAAVRHQVLQAIAHQVPIIGNQLTGNAQELRRSSIIGLIVGLAVLVWGATGLAQAGLFTMMQVWNLPGPARPGYFPRLGRALVLAQALGAYVVGHFRHTDAVYGAFATVLVLMAWISMSVEITVYAAELNVVLARRLWPRSIVQPPLTDADRAVLAAQALQNQRRDDQRVHVSYDDLPPHAAG